MSVTYSVPKYTDTTKGVQQFNAPLVSIQNTLNQLSSRIDSLHNKSAVVQYQVSLHSDAQVGHLVYFDTSSSTFKPALAALAATPGEQGQSVEAQSSRVQGLVLDTSPAVILRSGYYQDASIADSLLGVGAAAGLYYLSPQTAGKATSDPGWNMRQPVLSYYGDGKFSLFANYIAHDNHHHASTQVTWTKQEDQNPVFVCPQNVGQLSSGLTAVFAAGKLLTQGVDYTISDDGSYIQYIGVMDFETLSSYPSTLFNHFPFAYGDSVVRNITSDTFSIQNNNGTFNVQMPNYKAQSISYSSFAISKILNNKLYVTKVVSDIQSGMGISVSQGSYGKFKISLDQAQGSFRPASDMYLNGAQRTSNGLLTYTLFPSGVDSSVVISLPLYTSYVGDRVSVSLQVIANSDINLRYNLYYVPCNGNSVIPSPSLTFTGTVTGAQGTANTLIKVVSSQQTFTLARQGILIAQIKSPSSTSLNQYVYSAGFGITKLMQGQGSNSDTVPLDPEIIAYIDRRDAQVREYLQNEIDSTQSTVLSEVSRVESQIPGQIETQVQSQLEAYDTLSAGQQWGN